MLAEGFGQFLGLADQVLPVGDDVVPVQAEGAESGVAVAHRHAQPAVETFGDDEVGHGLEERIGLGVGYEDVLVAFDDAGDDDPPGLTFDADFLDVAG